MAVSDLYIPNASKWIEFYKSGGQLKKRRKNQTGGSFTSPGKTDIIPIESIKTPNTQTQITDVPVKIISPAQATVDQAKTEIDRKNKKKNSIKKKRQYKSHNRVKRRRPVKVKRAGKRTYAIGKKKNKVVKKKVLKRKKDIFDKF